MKTYVYGDPRGFDIYEDDTVYKEYFKQFYISSRDGRMMSVNRRDNGETVYNYLRYGLRESIDRPTRAFFGMSLVTDNFMYCPNFQILLEWFDVLFDKFVEKQQEIFQKESDGTLRYHVSKFSDCADDVEWLKGNLPNIFKRREEVQLLPYDGSFQEGKVGQVVRFRNVTDEIRILRAFKKYRWVSISSNIAKSNTSLPITDEPDEIELNYGDLNDTLNRLTQQLLPIALNPARSSCTEVETMKQDVQEICDSLCQYISTIRDKDEGSAFDKLFEKYTSLYNNIDEVLKKIKQSSVPPVPPSPPSYQHCNMCGEDKPSSYFSSREATICNQCLNKPKRKCKKCGNEKSIDSFEGDRTICKDCAKKRTGFLKNFNWKDALGKKKDLFTMIFGVIVLVLAFINSSGESSTDKVAKRVFTERIDLSKSDSDTTERTQVDSVQNEEQEHGDDSKRDTERGYNSGESEETGNSEQPQMNEQEEGTDEEPSSPKGNTTEEEAPATPLQHYINYKDRYGKEQNEEIKASRKTIEARRGTKVTLICKKGNTIINTESVELLNKNNSELKCKCCNKVKVEIINNDPNYKQNFNTQRL